jgi:2,3-bisphosphoglycerate-dependent phosphoglycerate mutase
MTIRGFSRLRNPAIALAIGLVLGLAACMTPRAEASAPAVYLMRHLPQADENSDSDLSERGRAMGAKLAQAFGAVPFAAVYATDTRRARQTAAFIAEPLGLETRIYDPRQPERLVAEATAIDGPVLIVGHSNTAPGLARLLGASDEAAEKLATFGQIGVAEAGRWHGLSLPD